MQQVSELSARLNQHFNWNKAKMDCFTGALIGLLKTRSVNLAEIATAFPSSALPESRYRRIQRLIHHAPIDYDAVALFVMTLFFFINTNYYLTLDRTNWQWGKQNINILVLAVVYQGQAIPIYWLLLDKKGNSNCRERIALMKRFIKHFGKRSIRGVLADREFIGSTWFKWLKTEKIPFHIRIKKNAKVPNSRGELVQAQLLFRFLKVGEKLVIEQAKNVTNVSVYLSGLRLSDGELLIVASSLATFDAIETYALRWQIETLFGCLKGRGFNLEDTHITDRWRIKRLLVVVVIAFCWTHRTGEWRHEHVNPIKVKKHQRLAKSIFKYGLDWMRDKLLDSKNSLESFCHDFLQFIDFKQFSTVT
jgi:Transposase DDE domain